jgi:hypothetical protein
MPNELFGLIGALLLNLSAAVGLTLIRAPRSNNPTILTGTIVVGGSIGCLAGLRWFLHVFSWFGLISWFFSCLLLVAWVWDRADGPPAAIGLASLVVGAGLLFVRSWLMN